MVVQSTVKAYRGKVDDCKSMFDCDHCGKEIHCGEESADHKKSNRWSLPCFRTVGCKINNMVTSEVFLSSPCSRLGHLCLLPWSRCLRWYYWPGAPGGEGETGRQGGEAGPG